MPEATGVPDPSMMRWTMIILSCVMVLGLWPAAAAQPDPARVTGVTLQTGPSGLQVTIATSRAVKYVTRSVRPDWIVVDIGAILDTPAGTLPVTRGPVQKIRVGQFSPDVARVVVELLHPAEARLSASPDGHAVIVSIETDIATQPAPAAPPPIAAARPARVKVSGITFEEGGTELRVAIATSGPARYEQRDLRPDWVVVDVLGAELALPVRALPGRGLVKRVRVGQFTPDVVRVVMELIQPVQAHLRTSSDQRVIIADLPAEGARPQADGGGRAAGAVRPAPPQAPSGSQTSQATNQTGPALASGYVLGPEDVLLVTVWGYPDLTGEAAVRPDGMVSVPLAGTVRASGLPVDQVTQALTRAYAIYILNPHVTVTVKEFRKIRVSVLGQVAHPGTYLLPPGSRVLDALSAAGGATDAATLTEAQLLPSRGSPVAMDLQHALAGDPAANSILRGGETLVVPEDLVNFISVNGEVAHPGRYRLKGEMHVLDALLAAGGLTDRASVTQARLVRASQESAPLNLDSVLLRQDMTQNVALSPGDTLFIPEETNNNIYVMGDVKNPGIFPLKGEVTLLQVLAMAGGPVQRGIGTAKTAYLFRRKNGAPQQDVIASSRATSVRPIGDRGVLMTVDLRAMMQGDLARDEAVRPGDVVVVPETGLNALQLILNTISTIIFGIHYLP